MNPEELINALRQTREGYDEEIIWHRFLLDAYTGTGGFEGKIKQPARAFLGWAAEVYGNGAIQQYASTVNADVTTYLDRYPREDNLKFQRRRDVANYLNYVEAILDTLMSYVLKNGMQRENVPKAIEAWQTDVNGQGQTWGALLDEVVKPRAALLGWAPLLFDAPPLPVREAGAPELTKAQTDELGIKPRAMALFPANLLDWHIENGEFVWAKVKLCYKLRVDPLGKTTSEEHITLWYPDHCDRYVVTKTEDGKESAFGPTTLPHTFGRVPIVIWRQKPNPEDSVYGLGMVDGVAKQCRRLFNLVSELDEILRQSVFPLLQVPIVDDKAPSEIIAGTDNAVGVPHDARQGYQWIAPPASVTDTYEKRIINAIREIYRLARDEYDDDSTVAESGVARAYKFEKTNRKIADFATQMGKAEKRCYLVVAAALGVPVDDVEKCSVIAPDDFRVEDLATDIANAIQAATLGLPVTAMRLLKERIIAKLLPNLPEEDKAQIESELEEDQAEMTRERQMKQELAEAQLDAAKNPKDDGFGAAA